MEQLVGRAPRRYMLGAYLAYTTVNATGKLLAIAPGGPARDRKDAWAMLRLPIMPNTSVNPEATRNSSMP
jgi:hypothetical protein